MPHERPIPHEGSTPLEQQALAERIPTDFLIGTATAAAQVEGAVHEGARTDSVWDRFSREPGRILDGSTTAIAADHYHRHAEDVDLMARLGADTYRFSLGWTRLQPNGAGPLDSGGVAFYDRLIDDLLEKGIAPFVTLSHWDLPVEYERGWLDRDTAYRLGEFAGLVAERFADRVSGWITINEPVTVTLNGYALGLHAPGESLLFDALPTVHNQLLGHGLAVQALRAASVSAPIGISNAHTPVVPAGEGEQHAAMAHLFDLIHNRVFADPVLTGRYPEVPAELADLFGAFAEVPQEDLDLIGQPIDFYGLNYYMPSRVAAGAGTGDSPDGVSAAMADLPFRLEPFPDLPVTGFGWPIAPEYLGTVLGQLRDRYGDALPPVYITENGASFDDEVAADGSVSDPQRSAYLARHLDAALTAVGPGGRAEGIDLRGLFVWSLMDNWEWAAGFTQRFGLVHVDAKTGRRTPKDSFRYLREVQRMRGRD